jgi:hypothetical protein
VTQTLCDAGFLLDGSIESSSMLMRWPKDNTVYKVADSGKQCRNSRMRLLPPNRVLFICIALLYPQHLQRRE